MSHTLSQSTTPQASQRKTLTNLFSNHEIYQNVKLKECSSPDKLRILYPTKNKYLQKPWQSPYNIRLQDYALHRIIKKKKYNQTIIKRY